MEQTDLFKIGRPRTQRNAPATSRRAADSLVGSLSMLQNIVLGYIINHRGTTDREMVEALRKEHGGSESTYRTRRSELVDLGLVKQLGVIKEGRNSHQTWAATEEAFRQ